MPVDLFHRECAAIREALETRGYNAELGSHVDVLDGSEVDASLLLMACFGYKDPADPHMAGTYERIQRELGHNGLIYRYRHGLDGLPPGEGAFGLTSFWAIDYLVRRGDVEEATARFEQWWDT